MPLRAPRTASANADTETLKATKVRGKLPDNGERAYVVTRIRCFVNSFIAGNNATSEKKEKVEEEEEEEEEEQEEEEGFKKKGEQKKEGSAHATKGMIPKNMAERKA